MTQVKMVKCMKQFSVQKKKKNHNVVIFWDAFVFIRFYCGKTRTIKNKINSKGEPGTLCNELSKALTVVTEIKIRIS